MRKTRKKNSTIQLQDASTQTDNVGKSQGKKIADIHETIKKENNRENLIKMLIKNWPGEAYVKTETKKEDILVQIQQKNTVVIVDVPPEAEKGIQLPKQIQPLIQDKQIKPGDIIRVKSSTALITEGNLEREHYVHTYIMGIDGSKGKEDVTDETLRVIAKLFDTTGENFLKEKECSYSFGTPHQKLETPIRKVLEYFGHKTETKFILKVSRERDRKNENNARKMSLHDPATENAEEMENDKPQKWEVQRKRNTKVKTIIITPKESNISYAGMLKNLRKDIDVEKIGVQVHRVQKSSDNSKIQIQFTCKEEDNAKSFEQQVASKIGESGKAQITEKTGTIVVRDLDPDVEQDELEEAVKKITGENTTTETRIMDSMNKRGLKHAFITMPETAIGKMLKQTRIHVGWSRCRIEEKFSLRRCFKCLRFGHVAAKCLNKEERAKSCFKCGQNDHTAKDCKNLSRCFECNTEEHRADSMLCPVYAKHVNEIRGKRRGRDSKDRRADLQ